VIERKKLEAAVRRAAAAQDCNTAAWSRLTKDGARIDAAQARNSTKLDRNFDEGVTIDDEWLRATNSLMEYNRIHSVENRRG